MYDSGLLYSYLALFVPGLADDPDSYRPRVMVERGEGGWKSVAADPIQTAAEALLAGAGVGSLTGCAIRQHGHDMTRVLRIDIDGGDAQVVVSALAGRYGPTALLVTRSRTPGRYHVVLRLLKPLRVHVAHECGKRLLRELVPTNRAVEVFPAPNRGLRLPFGAHGCDVAGDVGAISHTEACHPWELLRRAQWLMPIQLPKARRKGMLRRRRRSLGGRQRKGRTCEAADKLIKYGINAEARDRGERKIIIALHARGVPQNEAVSRMRQLIFGGLIDRTRYVAESRGVERARARRAADMPRRVGDYYERYLQAMPPPVHLSPYDVQKLTEHAQTRSVASGIPARDLMVFLYRILPAFKGAAHAHLSALQWHHCRWQEAATHSRYGYAVLRAAAGIFETNRSYLSLARAKQPDDAHAMRWRCLWLFDAGQPRRPLHTGSRPLTGAVTAAVGAARRRMARGYQPTKLVAQPDPKPIQVEMSYPSHGNHMPLLVSMVSIATCPPSAGWLAGTFNKPAPELIKSFPGSAQGLTSSTREQLMKMLADATEPEQEDRLLRELQQRAKLRAQRLPVGANGPRAGPRSTRDGPTATIRS